MSADKPTITVTGSYRKHLSRIFEARRRFLEAGAIVLRPHTEQMSGSDGSLILLEGDPHTASEVRRAQLQAIEKSDLLYVVNPGGYVGPAATADAGYAHRSGTLIVCSEPAWEDVVADMAGGVGSPDRALEILEGR